MDAYLDFLRYKNHKSPATGLPSAPGLRGWQEELVNESIAELV